MIERQGIVVWFQHMKNVRQLKKHGHLIHVSKKHRYAVIYVNREDIDAIEKSLISLLSFLKWNDPKSHLFRQIMKMQNRIRRSNMIIKWEFKCD